MDSFEANCRRRARTFEIDSPERWMALSGWDQRTLSIADVVAVLDTVDPDRGLLPEFLDAHPPSRFPREGWSLAQVYNYIVKNRGQSTDIIPRLFPTTSHPGTPARLLFTEAVEIGAGGKEFVVHAWDPRDNRGRIAIAYPVRDCPGGATPEAARQLLVRLSWASAVVVPADEDAPKGWDKVQPAVWVAGRSPRSNDASALAERYTWGDVAGLLHVNLPWWSRGLRDRDAMLIWRPDADQLEIAPGTAELDPRALREILTPDSSVALRETVADMIREIEHDLCGSYRYPHCHDHYTESRGLIQAATAAMDYRRPRPHRTSRPAALFLHQEVHNPLTAAHAASVAGGYPLAHSVYIVTPEHRETPIVREWLNQLRPSRRRDEIGFQLALRALPPQITDGDLEESIGYFTDPHWPDCWIVAQDKTVAVTYGTAVPAQGALKTAYVDSQVGFFTDSTGYAWPLPYPWPAPTDNTEALAQILSRLMLDAGADVADPEAAVETNLDLWQHIHTTGLPLVVNMGAGTQH